MIKSSAWTKLLWPLAFALAAVLIATAVLLMRGGAGSAGGAAQLMAAAQAARADARAAFGGDAAKLDALAAARGDILSLRSELAASGDGAAATFAADGDWDGAVRSLGEIVEVREDLLAARRARDGIEALLPDLLAAMGNLMASLAPQELDANRAQVERFELAVEGVRQDLAALAAADAVEPALAGLGDAGEYLGQVIRGLRGEDAGLGLTPPASAPAADLEAATAAFERARAALTALAAEAGTLAAAQRAMLAFDAAAESLMADYRALPAAGAPASAGNLPLTLTGAAFVLLVLMAFAYSRAREFRRAAEAQAEQNERNQQAILRLLDELSSLADGDLTVQATVTEDITGAIADSINYAIEALRELVSTVDESSILVDAAAKQSDATARHLVRSSEMQAKQVAAASESVAQMVQSIEEVSGNAERCSDVARHAVDVAHKGGEAVRRTIDGMNTIRETIQDTSKRIKRLGESSQEIGNIVELIEEIAEQTNILALNASIEASRAGEGSRGFAVVADEVQKLAERSSSATRKIEVLVSTIQSDTNEAVVSMERSTTDVVGGALLAENAGAALEEIEQVSHQIASLVQNISGSAREQTGATSAILENMRVLKDISAKTKESTNAASSAISKLSELASQLRRTVAGFTLPDQDQVGRTSGVLAPTPIAASVEPVPRRAPDEPAVRPEPRRRSG
ncbi:MAG: methyl-accepting chemotaxis protein [Gammaproteobacteria bacterium]|nr:methyl-accepting chemotaxis protein [Gammaproteobacteria bacterium]